MYLLTHDYEGCNVINNTVVNLNCSLSFTNYLNFKLIQIFFSKILTNAPTNDSDYKNYSNFIYISDTELFAKHVTAFTI